MIRLPRPTLFPLLPVLLVGTSALGAPKPVEVHWLEAPPGQTASTSFGVPWPRGAVQKSDTFSLTVAGGRSLPLQSWTLAYWPDGSIKWTGLAATIPGNTAGPFTIQVATPSPPATPLKAEDSADGIHISTAHLALAIPHAGESLFTSLALDGREIAKDARLTALLQNSPDDFAAGERTAFTSRVSKATLEQSGPVRAVVRLEGMHEAIPGDQNRGRAPRQFLPFIVRLYVYADQPSIRMVHTFIFDGDQKVDFLHGLGVRFTVPFREEVQNRHVRFSNSNGGLWAEPIQPMIGRQGRTIPNANGQDSYLDQIEGKRVVNRADAKNSGGRGGAPNFLDEWAIWDDFKLVQPNAEGFTITKRTNADSAWLHTNEGQRANGLAFIGDVSGGLAVSLRNFWQSYPASLEINHAASPAATLTAWLWSPDAPAMDLRHYDTRAHGLEASYEDVQEGFSTATGVARTSELLLTPTPDVPARADLVALADIGSKPPLLVASPEYLHSTGVFGFWSVKDTSTPFKKAIEDQLDAVLDFYLREPEQAKWYGFWYFGNVMHSYDAVRHNWRYDVGGTAWDNSELGTDMWLWYSFLRSGRADLYRFAEAMTRNTGEIATYHLGKFKGLGTRHGVIPWGDGAKEARISQAAYRRFFYYLSTDERTGDLMRDALSADFSAVNADPMREADPPTPEDAKFPTRVRGGPDWLAFCGNWMTEWERTGDVTYRDKIIAGAKCLAAMPYGFRSGTNLLYGYDPKTGQLFQRNNNIGQYNLATNMGGAEVGIELDTLLDDPSWRKIWRQFCRLHSAPADVVAKDNQSGNEGADGQYATESRLAAYASHFTGNPAFGARALNSIGIAVRPPRAVAPPAVLNPVEETAWDTNGAAQSSLTTIQLLDLLKDRLPTEAPAAGARGNRGRGGRGGRGRGSPAAAPNGP